jgi:hypothetical protein
VTLLSVLFFLHCKDVIIFLIPPNIFKNKFYDSACMCSETLCSKAFQRKKNNFNFTKYGLLKFRGGIFYKPVSLCNILLKLTDMNTLKNCEIKKRPIPAEMAVVLENCWLSIYSAAATVCCFHTFYLLLQL